MPIITTNKQNLDYVPFSQCWLWDKQRTYYTCMGINAWEQDDMPCYATGNPYIANAYAQTLVRYMQDLSVNKTYQPSEPLYILELGAGSGVFSFYLLKALVQLQQELGLTELKFCYVMTDFVKDNIKFWQQQPDLKPYIEQGMLDFGLFDIEKHQRIKLLKAQKYIAKGHVHNPLIVIANYFFDSLRQDFFRASDHKLQIGMVSASLQAADDLNNISVHLADLDPGYHYVDAESPYYKESKLDAVLQHFQATSEGYEFIFPIGPLRALKKLQAIANNKLLLMAADKAFTQHIAQYHYYKPEITFHRQAFSTILNFYALKEYVVAEGGDYFFTPIEQSITCCLFGLGQKFTELPETRLAAKSYLTDFNPGSLLTLYNFIETMRNGLTLEVIVAYLNISLWDRQVFDSCFPYIIQMLDSSSIVTIQNLLSNLEKVAANCYFLSNQATDTLSNIGGLLQKLGHYQRAVNYYKRSLDYFGPKDDTLYNMAMCHYRLNEYPYAIQYLEQIESQDNIAAMGWLAYFKQEQSKLL